MQIQKPHPKNELFHETKLIWLMHERFTPAIQEEGGTFCNHTMRFWIHVNGFPLSKLLVSIPLMLVSQPNLDIIVNPQSESLRPL